ncbi:uncharacterized protein LOC18440207 isoform X2 [Amborella trichopoda]|uniref:uncharacterized protein LOC18440207 isoform X2 n=1 Tax=Amborella trichopoda TaxID=13333 RepID=UPI0009BF1FDA|nr:uncharacterized protein LOC18440207 isoform X2 [Amborella trichopoda]|eukprot:XP_020526619.1 uncharacterized protein LOC18440207 isoform X2 [Amborella trichopoda]
MAEDLDDGEFWLPSEFLADDALWMENKRVSHSGGTGAFFPHEFPYGDGSCGFGHDSSLYSPVESVVGSTETESDEEDYISGLAHRMAGSMLDDDEKMNMEQFPWLRDGGFGNQKSPTALSGSPQSTLCGIGSWSGCSNASNGSRGSSNGPSQVSSPPSTPLNHKEDAWNLLYEAAGQVVRLKMNDEASKLHSRGLLGPPKRPGSINKCASHVKPPAYQAFFPQQASNLLPDKSKEASFLQLKQQHAMKQQSDFTVWARQAKAQQTQQLQGRVRSCSFGARSGGKPLGFSSPAWIPPQQQIAGSGMRAVFLNGTGSRRESGGTGVFLPRRAGSPNEMRKKPACSTVLLPARVVQALNLNLDDMGPSQPCFQSGSALSFYFCGSFYLSQFGYISTLLCFCCFVLSILLLYQSSTLLDVCLLLPLRLTRFISLCLFSLLWHGFLHSWDLVFFPSQSVPYISLSSF